MKGLNIDMLAIIFVLGAPFVIAFIGYFISRMSQYLNSIKEGSVRITYKQFLNMFFISPKKWEFNYCKKYFIYFKEKNERNYWEEPFESIPVSFRFLDYYRAIRYYKNYEENKKNKMEKEKSNTNYQLLLEGVLKDAKKLQEQSNQEIKQAASIAVEVARRLENNA